MPKATEYTLIFDQVKQNQNDCEGHKLQLQPLWDTHFISNWKQLVYRSTCLFQANPTLIELTGNTTKTQT